MNKLLSLFCLVTFFIASCGDDPVKPCDNAKQIWPMAVGNYWKYEVYSVFKDSAKFMYIVEYNIPGKVNISGEDWFLTSYNDRMGINIYVNKPDGLWYDRHDSVNRENTDEMHLKFKFPTIAGDKVIWEDDTTQTISIDVPVSVPAGNFKCIHYFTRINHEDNFYICPGIGLVRHALITAYEDGKPVWIEWRLVEYKVK